MPPKVELIVFYFCGFSGRQCCHCVAAALPLLMHRSVIDGKVRVKGELIVVVIFGSFHM